MRSFSFLILLIAGLNAAPLPAAASSEADGDVTLLSSYEVPIDRKDFFESAAIASVKMSASRSTGMWLMYEELEEGSTDSSMRYFTVHFPDNLEQLTEPTSDVYELVTRLGNYRINTELTRQVPDWCSTTALDADKLQFAYVEYLWLKPHAFENVDRILARRGEIMRTIYGTSSDGNLAAEGFVAMASPFQAMHVLFSVAETRESATKILRTDLEEHDFLAEWDSLERDLSRAIEKRSSRSGKFRRTLSAIN